MWPSSALPVAVAWLATIPDEASPSKV